MLVGPTAIFTSFAGMISVILGVSVSEFVRRRNRADAYSNIVFQKRLEAYEGLFDIVRRQYVHDLIFNGNASAELAHDIVGEAVHEITGYCDANAFYLSHTITVAVCTLPMGLEGYHLLEEGAREGFRDDYLSERRHVFEMIIQESGMKKISSIFDAVHGAAHTNAAVEYYREAETMQRRKRQQKQHE